MVEFGFHCDDKYSFHPNFKEGKNFVSFQDIE